ncbi:MAG: iron ABC transporter permease [Candidatus Hydrogenedentes bacterium]|nr:iron ABC transporter permease [Candidatus Hydrogenedentota bacterium]
MSEGASSNRHKPALDRVLLALCLGVLGLTVLYPTLRLMLEAVAHWDGSLIGSGKAWPAIRNTIGISLASVAGAGIVGVALAFVTTRYSFPGSRVLAALAYLPFTLPPLVGVLSFYYLIGKDGIVTRFADQVLGLPDLVLPGPWAILIIHIYSFYVFFYAMAGPAFASMDRYQLEAARTLGASRGRVFFRVTLPLLRPALVGASLLTFMSSCASFSAPYFFGGRFPMLSVEVYVARNQDNHGAALTLTVMLALVSLLGIALFRSSRRGASGSGSKGTPRPIGSARGRILAGALAWGAIALLLLPHATILWLSFADYESWHTELVPTVMTFSNYTELFTSRNAFSPIRNSLWMSAVAMVATLVMALPAAYLIARKRPGGAWLNVLVMIPWALPGTVIAINLIVAFNERWLPIYGTVWLLPLAYFVRNIPLLTRMVGASLETFDATLIEAGRTLGASKRHCFRRIVLPLVAPAAGAGAALVFATCLGEFVASILLYQPSNIPIAVKINMEWRASVGAAFAYSVLLMVLVAGTFGVSRRFTSRLM